MDVASSLLQAHLFDGVETGFLRAMSTRIKTILYLPKQIIINRGDIGHQMYFVHKGEVEVSLALCQT